MKILLIGKNGQLGWEFQRTLPNLGELISLGREELDVADLDAVTHTLNIVKPNLIINASAYTEVDLAEKEISTAMKINALAPGVMAETARKIGAVFVHYSTDYVFDGRTSRPYTEQDITNPLNVYGQSKLTGEKNIEQSGDAYLILRTSWVYSLRGNSFVNKVLGWSRKHKILKIVSDQVSNPTWARKLAETTTQALSRRGAFWDEVRDRRGIYHLAGSGFTSRYEWATRILAYDPKPAEQLAQSIEPASSEEFPTPATRPLFSSLDCTRFQDTFGLSLPGWDECLRQAMAG